MSQPNVFLFKFFFGYSGSPTFLDEFQDQLVNYCKIKTGILIGITWVLQINFERVVTLIWNPLIHKHGKFSHLFRFPLTSCYSVLWFAEWKPCTFLVKFHNCFIYFRCYFKWNCFTSFSYYYMWVYINTIDFCILILYIIAL